MSQRGFTDYGDFVVFVLVRSSLGWLIRSVWEARTVRIARARYDGEDVSIAVLLQSLGGLAVH